MERRYNFLIPYRLWVGKSCRLHVCPSFEPARQQTGVFPQSLRIDCTGEAKICGKQESHSFWGNECTSLLCTMLCYHLRKLHNLTLPLFLSSHLSQLFQLFLSAPSARVAQPRRTLAVILQRAALKHSGSTQHHQAIYFSA